MIKLLSIISMGCLIYTCSFNLKSPKLEINYEEIKNEVQSKENKVNTAKITAINTAVRGVLIK